MTYLEPEDILRQALYAAVESVEPAPDGLARIHARLSTPRPLMVARLMAGWETLCQFVMLRLEFAVPRLEPARAALVSWLDTALPAAHRRLHPMARRLRPMIDWSIAVMAWLGRLVQPRTGPEGRSSRYGWVRSVAAMAAVVLVAVATGVALSVLPHQIVQEAQSVFSSQTGGPGGGTHNSGVTGTGTPVQPSSGASGWIGGSPTPTPSCGQTAKAKPKPSPTASPSPTTPPPTTPPPTTPPPTTPPPTTPPPTTPPPTSGPDQGTSSNSDTQSAQDSSVVIGAQSGSGAAASPTPSPTCSPAG